MLNAAINTDVFIENYTEILSSIDNNDKMLCRAHFICILYSYFETTSLQYLLEHQQFMIVCVCVNILVISYILHIYYFASF